MTTNSGFCPATLAGGGRFEQACAAWGEALDHMGGVRSVRTVNAVGRMRSDGRRLTRRGVRAAAELEERAVVFLASV